MIKCVLCDLDGTILEGGYLSDNNRRAIRMLEENGIRFIAATGRSVDLCREFTNVLGFNCDRMLMNGGCYVNKDDEVIFLNSFTEEELSQCIDVIQTMNAAAVFNGLEHMFLLSTKEFLRMNFDTAVKANGFEGFPESFYREAVICDRESLLKEKIIKIELMSVDQDFRSRVMEELRKIKGINVSSAFWFNIEVNPFGSDKGLGARKICEHYGYHSDEVACFGDSENDIPMLEEFTYSYAMGQANDHVKACSGYVCESCKDDGFYHQVVRILQGITDGCES